MLPKRAYLLFPLPFILLAIVLTLLSRTFILPTPKQRPQTYLQERTGITKDLYLNDEHHHLTATRSLLTAHLNQNKIELIEELDQLSGNLEEAHNQQRQFHSPHGTFNYRTRTLLTDRVNLITYENKKPLLKGEAKSLTLTFTSDGPELTAERIDSEVDH